MVGKRVSGMDGATSKNNSIAGYAAAERGEAPGEGRHPGPAAA